MRNLVLCLCLLLTSFARAEAVHVPQKDAITDKDTSAVAISGAPSGTDLIVRCAGNIYEIYATESFHFIDKDAFVRVITRFDQESPTDYNDLVSYDYDGRGGRFYCEGGTQGSCRWSLSTEGTAVFVPKEFNSVVLTGIKDKKSLLIRTFNYQGTPHDWTFNLTGASAQLKKLQCLPEKNEETAVVEPPRAPCVYGDDGYLIYENRDAGAVCPPKEEKK